VCACLCVCECVACRACTQNPHPCLASPAFPRAPPPSWTRLSAASGLGYWDACCGDEEEIRKHERACVLACTQHLHTACAAASCKSGAAGLTHRPIAGLTTWPSAPASAGRLVQLLAQLH